MEMGCHLQLTAILVISVLISPSEEKGVGAHDIEDASYAIGELTDDEKTQVEMIMYRFLKRAYNDLKNSKKADLQVLLRQEEEDEFDFDDWIEALPPKIPGYFESFANLFSKNSAAPDGTRLSYYLSKQVVGAMASIYCLVTGPFGTDTSCDEEPSTPNPLQKPGNGVNLKPTGTLRPSKPTVAYNLRRTPAPINFNDDYDKIVELGKPSYVTFTQATTIRSKLDNFRPFKDNEVVVKDQMEKETHQTFSRGTISPPIKGVFAPILGSQQNAVIDLFNELSPSTSAPKIPVGSNGEQSFSSQLLSNTLAKFQKK